MTVAISSVWSWWSSNLSSKNARPNMLRLIFYRFFIIPSNKIQLCSVELKWIKHGPGIAAALTNCLTMNTHNKSIENIILFVLRSPSWFLSTIARHLAVYWIGLSDYLKIPEDTAVASMTFRRKPFRRMRLSVESDITSNATIRRIFVEKQLVEWTSVEIPSKFGRKMR